MKKTRPVVGPSQRPLRACAEGEIALRFEQALAAGDGTAGAHCIHEWWLRGQFPTAIETAQQRLWERASASVPEWLPMNYVHWLPQVYSIAASFTAAASGRSRIYLVLLDFSDRRGETQGIYVGMSRYAAAQRFDQHKQGIRAAGSVLKRGVEVLTGPVMHLQFISRADAVRIERDLALALADAGLLVEGGH